MIQIIPNWHPILVHFTVALFSISILLFLVSLLLGEGKLRTQLLNAAYWNLWLGTAFTIGTLIAGWLAYNSVAHDTPSHVQMTTHKNWAFATAGGFALLFLWSLFERKKARPGVLFVLLGLVAMGGLAGTAWHGGEAVYRFGLGVMSLPKTTGKGHDHKHADGTQHSHGTSEKKSENKQNTNKKPGHSHTEGEKDKPANKQTEQAPGHSHTSPGTQEAPSDGHDHTH